MLIRNKTLPPEELLVARSGYDSAHGCGFIAAKSAVSAEWHKEVIAGFNEGHKKFRAWSRGEQPTLFLLRIYLPTRYNIISTPEAANLLITYNPFLRDGSFTLQKEETVSQGRALFFNITRASFLKVRENYKLNFPLGEVDCNNATPKASATLARPATLPQLMIPPPPTHTLDQVNQAISCIATPPTAKSPPTAQSTPRTGAKAILPANAIPPSPLKTPTHSPAPSRETSTDSSASDSESPRTVAKREAQLEISGSSNSSKGSHRSRTKDRRSSSKRKRDDRANPSHSSSSSSRRQSKKRH